MSQTTASEIYLDGTYLAENPNWHADDSPWKARQISALLRSRALQPKTVCEVGCGVGQIVQQLSHEFPNSHFYGYEISQHAYQQCQEKSSDNLEFRFGDLLQDSNAHFDLLMAIDVIEHVENCLEFLRELRSKGDLQLFHIPLELSAQAVIRSRPLMSSRSRLGHLHYFTKDLALETLQRAGYELIDYHYTCWAMETNNRGWRSRLLKLPRTMVYRMSADLAPKLFGGFSLLVLAR